jgi:hypothetical protein
MIAKAPWVACALVLALGCAHERFDTVVRIAATAQPDYCGRLDKVTRLNAWAFKVTVCDRVAFYRCHYRRKSAGKTQCCRPMPDESSATSFVGPLEPTDSTDPPDLTCIEFAD